MNIATERKLHREAIEALEAKNAALVMELADWKRNAHIYLVQQIDKLESENAALRQERDAALKHVALLKGEPKTDLPGSDPFRKALRERVMPAFVCEDFTWALGFLFDEAAKEHEARLSEALKEAERLRGELAAMREEDSFDLIGENVAFRSRLAQAEEALKLVLKTWDDSHLRAHAKDCALRLRQPLEYGNRCDCGGSAFLKAIGKARALSSTPPPSPSTTEERLRPRPGDPDKARGLYRKFRVERLTPSETHVGCEYYVLDCDHDAYAIPALEAYAKSCEGEYPLLAKGIRELLAAKSAPSPGDTSHEPKEEA